MQIQDFNQPSGGQQESPPAAAIGAMSDSVTSSAVAPECCIAMTDIRERTETALLKKRIEHLELVVETARSLMTSNQEKLLRRLHDLPQELMALTSVLNRLGHDGPTSSEVNEQPLAAQAPARRVA